MDPKQLMLFSDKDLESYSQKDPYDTPCLTPFASVDTNMKTSRKTLVEVAVEMGLTDVQVARVAYEVLAEPLSKDPELEEHFFNKLRELKESPQQGLSAMG